MKLFNNFLELIGRREKKMSTQKILKEFEIIYKNTYNKILKYVICKCSNLDDVNDIIQETYIEFYKKRTRKSFTKGREDGNINGHSTRESSERTLKTEQERIKHNVN